MHRPPRSPIVALLVGLLWLAACASSSTRSPRPNRSRGPVRPFAEILRAEDRQQVDAALRAASGHGRAAVRAAAVRALGRIGDPESRQDVRRALGDDAAIVRAEAAWALARLDPEAAARELGELARDPQPEVRVAVANALGLAGRPAAAALLETLLDDADPAVLRHAALAAGHAEKGDFAIERLIGLSARDDDSATQLAATWALARLTSQPLRLGSEPKRRAKTRLREMATSLRWEIRSLVAAGHALPADSSDAEVLARLLDDRDARVRVAATRSFCFIGATVEPYVAKALADQDPRVVLAAVQGLGRMRGQDTIDRLTRIIVYDERVFMQVEAIGSAIRAEPELAAAIANGLSRADEAPVRAAAARALAGRADERSLEIARRLAGDADPLVRAAAIPVLGAAPGPLDEPLGEAPGAPLVIRRALVDAAAARLRSTDDAERRAEALDLLEREWNRASEADGPGLYRRLLDVAQQAAETDRAAMALVRRGLDAPHWWVRRDAARRLAAHGEPVPTDAVGPASERPIEFYEELVDWSRRPRAAIVTVRREGFRPGRFTVRLDAERAPLAAWNFWQLAEQGFFTDLRVHRVVPEILLEDGDALGDGTGDPGFWIRDQIRADPFERGTLVLASEGEHSGGSRWFVTLTAQPQLSGRHTAFGQVVQNMDGVVGLVLPGDWIAAVTPYEGTGDEPLP